LICSVALSFRFPPDPQNGFSVDELNPRQNMAFWERDLIVCWGQHPRIEPVPLQSIGPKLAGWVALDEFEQWRRMTDKSAEDKRAVANRPAIWG